MYNLYIHAQELKKIPFVHCKITGVARVDDDDIRSSAEALVRTHGDEAAAICGRTAERWLRRGDVGAAQLWGKLMTEVRYVLASRARIR